MGIDRPEPIASYSERQGFFRRVTYSLYPGKVLVRMEKGFNIAEFYLDVMEIAEGQTDKPVEVGFFTALFGGLSICSMLAGAAGAVTGEPFWPAVICGCPGAMLLAYRFFRPGYIRIVSVPARGLGLEFRIVPRRMSQIEAFIRAMMRERERMMREGPTIPLGPRENLNSAGRLLRLKAMLDRGLITGEQFERFKEMALKAP